MADAPSSLPAPRDLHCRILYLGRTEIGPEWAHSLCNPFWRLYQNRDDGAAVSSPAGLSRFPAGRIVLLPAWGRFTSRCTGRVRHFYVHFDPVEFGNWGREHFTRPIVLPPDTDLERAAERLAETMEAQPTWRLRAQALTLGALAVALERLPPGPLARFDQLLRGDNPLATALRYIEDQLHLPLPIPVLATICHLSVDHFARVFRQRFGQTPTAYVQERRVAVAAERLVAGNEDIDAIATATGFANRYHFTRVFTHRMGTPPAAYRRRGRV